MTMKSTEKPNILYDSSPSSYRKNAIAGNLAV